MDGVLEPLLQTYAVAVGAEDEMVAFCPWQMAAGPLRLRLGNVLTVTIFEARTPSQIPGAVMVTV